MFVSALSLTDFRSYDQASFSLTPGVSVFVGANGQGKTNLMEAIAFASTLDSHRVANNSPLVRVGADRAVVQVEIVHEGRPTLLEADIVPGSAIKVRVNRTAVPRSRDIVGRLRTVMFSPEDLVLVKGDPADRRRFLDELITLHIPRMAGVRSDYERVLKQRNTLLKSARQASRRPDPHLLSTLDVWNGQLARFGADIVAARMELIRALGPTATRAYAAVAPEGAERVVSMRYASSLGDFLPETPDRDSLMTGMLEALQARQRDELDRGVTLVGPHRDELLLFLGATGQPPMPAKGYASHGESWSLALALRLAAFWLLKDDAEGEPVLILDDVFAELDAGRRDRLAAHIRQAEQVLITAAVAQDVPDSLTGERFAVSSGQVSHVPA